MYKFICIWTLCLICSFAQSKIPYTNDTLLNLKLSNRHCHIAGTQWAMIPPDGFLPNIFSFGYHTPDKKNFIYIREHELDTASTQRQCINSITKPKHYIINGNHAYFFEKEENECYSSFGVLYIQFTDKQLELVIMDDNNTKIYESMKESLFSFVIDSNFKSNCNQTFNFSLDLSKSKLQQSKCTSFERILFEPIDNTDSSLLEITVKQDASVCPKSEKEYLKNKSTFIHIQKLEFRKFKIDNLTAYEFSGIQRTEFNSRYFYKLYIDGKDINYSLEGFSKNAEQIDLIKNAALSFKISKRLCL